MYGQSSNKRQISKTQHNTHKDKYETFKENILNLNKLSPKFLKPKNLLPNLHQKTHFKAAVEYTLGEEVTLRSLHDKNNEIEQMLYDNYQKK